MICNRIRSFWHIVGAATVALIVVGCAAGPSYQEQYFILDAARQGSPVQPVSDGSLRVHRLSVDAAFATKNLVYRLDEFRYEADAYRQFLILPGVMITEKTRDWLADAGLFHTVLPLVSRVVPTYTLEGNVTALYGDFTNESSPTAAMEIQFFLVTTTDGAERVLFSHVYRAASPVSSRATMDFVNAMNRSLAEILTHLEADLQKVLVARTQASSAP